MRKSRFAAAVLLAFSYAAASCGGPSEIVWSEDLASAMAASATDARPVLLYFTYDT